MYWYEKKLSHNSFWTLENQYTNTETELFKAACKIFQYIRLERVLPNAQSYRQSSERHDYLASS